MLEDLVQEEGFEESDEMQEMQEMLEMQEMQEMQEMEEMQEMQEMQKIQSVQDEKIKPMQGSWNWNPNDMTFSWSIKRPRGSPDRYTLAFKQEGIEFDKEVGSEKDKLEDFDTEDSEGLAGFEPVILTGTK